MASFGNSITLLQKKLNEQNIQQEKSTDRNPQQQSILLTKVRSSSIERK
jgi:hypothetical protein